MPRYLFSSLNLFILSRPPLSASTAPLLPKGSGLHAHCASSMAPLPPTSIMHLVSSAQPPPPPPPTRGPEHFFSGPLIQIQEGRRTVKAMPRGAGRVKRLATTTTTKRRRRRSISFPGDGGERLWRPSWTFWGLRVIAVAFHGNVSSYDLLTN